MQQTTLDLNGPILSFATQPVGVTTNNAGIATFVGICTAYFIEQDPTNIFASNTGSVAHRWYAVGFGALSDGSFKEATLSGTATTTLTISNALNPTISGTQFYVEADYIPSAYQSSSPVTAGTARSTGNAVNETLNSNIATLTVRPSLSITTQPVSTTIAQGITATFTVSSTITDATTSDISYQWYIDGVSVSDGTSGGNTISGATTDTLTIATSENTSSTTFNVYVVVSHPTAGNSPITSTTSTLTVVNPRKILNFEFINPDSSVATLLGWNLSTQGNYNYTNTTTTYPTVVFYASERDLDLELELYAAKGLDAGNFRGGEGGVSVIRFTAKKNEEYVIAPLPKTGESGAIYLYRKSRLIAVVGSGGNAAQRGSNGGAGGGVNVAGQSTSIAPGGPLISAGTLPQTGIFGSASTLTPLTELGDTKAIQPDGGRVLPCTRGDYWRTQGKQPCEDLGNIQFYLSSGTLVTNSATISRGYKDGYSIRNTEGNNVGRVGGIRGGEGGQGATGGSGSINFDHGGGGGSGYTDGSVTIVSTQQGGNNGDARVVFKLVS